MGQHHGPWGDLRVWGHQPEGRTGQVREEKNPRTNRRGRGGENRRRPDRWGALPSSGGPWSASSHCGHQRAAAEQSTGRCGPHAPPAAAWGQPAACPPPCPPSQDKGQVQAGGARAAAPADCAGQATRKEQQGTHRVRAPGGQGAPVTVGGTGPGWAPMVRGLLPPSRCRSTKADLWTQLVLSRPGRLLPGHPRNSKDCEVERSSPLGPTCPNPEQGLHVPRQVPTEQS